MTRSMLSTALGVLGVVALLYALYAVHTAQAQTTPSGKVEVKKGTEQPTATVRFERLKAVGAPYQAIYRSKVPGGWLMGSFGNSGTMALSFYPDPDHRWDGNSIP